MFTVASDSYAKMFTSDYYAKKNMLINSCIYIHFLHLLSTILCYYCIHKTSSCFL